MSDDLDGLLNRLTELYREYQAEQRNSRAFFRRSLAKVKEMGAIFQRLHSDQRYQRGGGFKAACERIGVSDDTARNHMLVHQFWERLEPLLDHPDLVDEWNMGTVYRLCRKLRDETEGHPAGQGRVAGPVRQAVTSGTGSPTLLPAVKTGKKRSATRQVKRPEPAQPEATGVSQTAVGLPWWQLLCDLQGELPAVLGRTQSRRKPGWRMAHSCWS